MNTHRFVIYASGHRSPDVYSRTYVPVFETAEQARSWLRRFIADKDHQFVKDTIILETDFTIKLRSHQWREIMAAEGDPEGVTDEEASYILRFKYGTWDEVHTKDAPADECPASSGAPRRLRVARDDKPSGYVTITELCIASGILPRIARAALRSSGRIKPSYGWAFSPEEAIVIKKLIGCGS